MFIAVNSHIHCFIMAGHSRSQVSHGHSDLFLPHLGGLQLHPSTTDPVEHPHVPFGITGEDADILQMHLVDYQAAEAGSQDRVDLIERAIADISKLRPPGALTADKKDVKKVIT